MHYFKKFYFILQILENYKVKTNLQIIHTKFVPPNYRHTENIIIKTILIGDECDTLKIGENFDCTGYFRLELDNVRSKLDVCSNCIILGFR